MSSPRAAAIAAATAWFDSGAMLAELGRRVAFRTESQDSARTAALASYLNEDIGPSVARCGFEWSIWPNPVPGAPPLLFAERHEDDASPTVLIYGHGDVVAGYD
jgi:acetylornithine deacetylase/succinyl-diaminopimelate desuccinylase-like protein